MTSFAQGSMFYPTWLSVNMLPQHHLPSQKMPTACFDWRHGFTNTTLCNVSHMYHMISVRGFLKNLIFEKQQLPLARYEFISPRGHAFSLRGFKNLFGITNITVQTKTRMSIPCSLTQPYIPLAYGIYS